MDGISSAHPYGTPVIGPLQDEPELAALLKRAREWWATATDAEKEDMLRKQRESFVRAEMSWPRDCPYR